MADLMGIGVSGLLAYQRALTTTGHNISNVNTEGYSRQRVDLATREPHVTGAGSFGQGVNVVDVTRTYNEFLVENLRNNVSSSSRMDTYYELASQVDNLLADPMAGLTPALQDFFDSVQGVADNPSSISARQVMITSGESLVERFQSLDERLSNLSDRVNRQMESSVAVVNELATNIADLNVEIARYRGASGGRDPNDLLDRRDQLLKDLAEHVPVNTVEQSDGMTNVFIGTGQALVVGGDASQLALRDGEFADTPKRLVLDNGSTGVDITNTINGGGLGGALDFVDNMLEPTRAEMGRIAVGLGLAFNEQHQLGKDLSDNMGGDFFTDLTTSSAVGSSKNDSATTIDIITTIDDVTKLEASDYQLDYDGANYTLRRLSDNTVVGGPAALPMDLSATEGFTISVNANPASITAGDSFLIRPVSRGSAAMGVDISEAAQIAAGGAIIGQEAVDASGFPTNGGSGVMGSVVPSNNNGLLENWGSADTVGLTYDDVADTFTLGLPGGWTSVPAGPLSYDPATDAGTTYTLTLDDGGGNSVDVTFELDGSPVTGDVFNITVNSGAPGDNSNALALGALQTDKVLVNGTTGFQSAYSGIVSDVGTGTHQAKVGSDAQQTLLRQAEAARSAASGVNLDEEAADLMRYQMAYQATARVITAANDMFQTLLGMTR